MLGDIFFKLAKLEKKKFLVETHSDFTIDRFRLNMRKNETKIPSQILFFERTAEGNKVYEIPIDDEGELPEEQPKQYRDFFVREQMDILGL
jgi:predicted ATPase